MSGSALPSATDWEGLRRCSLVVGLCLLCSCHGIGRRKQEQSAALAPLPPSQRQFVSEGRINPGMDTNAVYIAWGKPSAAIDELAPDRSRSTLTWLYYGNRPVVVPGWSYLPDSYGTWTLQYNPSHHSERFTRAVVVFQNNQVVEWKSFEK